MLFGRIEACPVSARPPALRLAPCASFDLGEIRAEGSGSAAQTSSNVWAAIAVGGRAEWSAGGPVVVTADVSGTVPLTHYSFVVAGDRELTTGAKLGVSAAIGAGFRLP